MTDHVHQNVEASSPSVRIFHLDFLQLANKLKVEWRHSWPQGHEAPRESVAAHSWRLALMLMMYHDKFDRVVDLSRCLQMAIIHDLPEAIVGDLPLLEQTSDGIKAAKREREQHAMQQMLDMLGKSEDHDMQTYLHQLYEEYEAQHSYESKVVKALDKIEAFQQHNEDPMETWVAREKEMLFQEKYMMDYCLFDSFLTHLASEVMDNGVKKLEANGEDVPSIRQRALGEASASLKHVASSRNI